VYESAEVLFDDVNVVDDHVVISAPEKEGVALAGYTDDQVYQLVSLFFGNDIVVVVCSRG
jgi:hypothetical protein